MRNNNFISEYENGRRQFPLIFFKILFLNDLSSTIFGENMQIKRISLSLDASKSEDNKRKKVMGLLGPRSAEISLNYHI